MLNMIKAELYKTGRRAYPKIFLLVVLGGIVGLNLLLYFTNNYADTKVLKEEMLMMYLACLVAGMYLAIITADMVFSDEYKHSTLKNTIAFGYTRTQVYFSKLITACIVTVVMALAVEVVLLASCWLMFPSGENDGRMLTIFLQYSLACVPLWLSQVAIAVAIWFNIKSSTFATVLVVCFTAILPSVLSLMTLILSQPVWEEMAKWLPVSQFELYRSLFSVDDIVTVLPRMCGVGAAWFVGVTVIGWLCFYRREVK